VRWLGYKQLATGSVVLDMPDIKRRMKAPHVAALSEDAAQAGNEYIHAPTVRGSDRRLVCGRDRMAGALLKKRKRMWLHLVEATDQEIAELEERENIYRRHSDGERAQSLARLVELQKQKIRADEKAASGDNVPTSGTASKTPKSEQTVTSEARKAVARAAGVSPAAVKQAEKRAAAAKSEEATEQMEAEAPLPLPDGFNAFDLEVSKQSVAAIRNASDLLKDCDQMLRKVLHWLTDAKKNRELISEANAQKIKERVEQAGHAIRDAIPASLCYFCKSLDALKAACPACGSMGVVGRHGGDNVPPELKTAGDKARVAVNGKFVLVGAAENASVGAEAEPAKPAKSIKVTQVDGSVADLDSVIDDDAQAF
jgi:hypothetical protein